MTNPEKKSALSQRIREIIQKFEEQSEGEIKQKDIAKSLDISESTLTRAKSPYYKMSINTLRAIKDDLEELFQEYEKSPNTVLLKLKVESNNLEKKSILKQRGFIYLASLLTLSIFIILLFRYFEIPTKQLTTNIGEYYTIDLTNNALDSLLGKEWFIKDSDSSLLEEYKDSKFLTIETENGDYFTRFGDDHWIEKIKNLFYRKINCGSCCIITLKLSDFHPVKPYQQAGFLLFYSDTINPRHYTRMTYSYKGDPFSTSNLTEVLPIFYDYNSDYFRKNGSKSLKPAVLPRPYDPSLKTDSIWLRTKIVGNYYSFSYRRNNIKDYSTLNSGNAFQVGLGAPPQIIALGAWQGNSTEHEMRLPLVQPIPATFKSLTIAPCNN